MWALLDAALSSQWDALYDANGKETKYYALAVKKKMRK